MDFDTNKAKWPQGFDIILKSDMSQTYFRVWDMTISNHMLKPTREI